VLLAPAINVAAAVDAACRWHLNDVLTYECRTLEEVVAVIASATGAAPPRAGPAGGAPIGHESRHRCASGIV
jgi:hypothetical protein